MEDDDEELLAAGAPPTKQLRPHRHETAEPPETKEPSFLDRMEAITVMQSDSMRADLICVEVPLDQNVTCGLSALETKVAAVVQRLETATTKNGDDIADQIKRRAVLENRPDTVHFPAHLRRDWRMSLGLCGSWGRRHSPRLGVSPPPPPWADIGNMRVVVNLVPMDRAAVRFSAS